MNKQSNRAHRLFSFITQFRRGEAWHTTTLTLVDLAGSEDINRSGAVGVAAKEASHINKSLLTLGRVINALASNSPHIPYRESKLTRLLSEALGGVCKTTFVACVSPAASSATETSSTLRYAKRASEALNISQLPRWQQDSILIDGLTRRVQMLESELSSKDGMHLRELSLVQTKLDAARRENGSMLEALGRAKTQMGRMGAQQAAVRRALQVVGMHRDRLQAKASTLQAELLETRRARDGALADREALCGHLAAVRCTRDSLLQAYGEVEGRLTADCGALKGTIERALREMGALHAEIGRKKALSSHNERAADEFGDDMTARLRAAVEAVFAFREGQGERAGAAQSLLSDVGLEREGHAAAVTADVRKLSSAIGDVFTGLAETVAAGEAAARARSLRLREDTRTALDGSAGSVGQLQEAVGRGLAALRSQCGQLEDSLKAWAGKVSARVEGMQGSTAGFCARLADDLTALHTLSAEAAASHVARLQEHEAAIVAFRTSEQAAAASAAQRMVAELTAHVTRAINEQAADAARRLERATGGLRDESQAIAGSIADASKTHAAHVGMVAQAGAAHRDLAAAEVAEGRKQSSAAHEAAAALTVKVGAAAKALGADVSDRSAAVTASLAAAKADVAARTMEADAAGEKLAGTVREKAAAGASAAHASAEGLCAAVKEGAEAAASTVQYLQSALEEAGEHVQAFVDAAAGTAKEQEAATSGFVHNTLRRDTSPVPQPGKYVYPTAHASMRPYSEVVAAAAAAAAAAASPADGEPAGAAGDAAAEDAAALSTAWATEEAVRAGTRLPGRGTDFPGDLAPPDYSGVLTTPTGPSSDAARRALVGSVLEQLRGAAGAAAPAAAAAGGRQPDWSTLPTAALRDAAADLVAEVESTAATMDAELESWFAALSALSAERGGKPTIVGGAAALLESVNAAAAAAGPHGAGAEGVGHAGVSGGAGALPVTPTRPGAGAGVRSAASSPPGSGASAHRPSSSADSGFHVEAAGLAAGSSSGSTTPTRTPSVTASSSDMLVAATADVPTSPHA
jgi:hypothetical protein